MWLKLLLFGFTERLELKPDCRTSQSVYEEIGPESHIELNWIEYCEKCELQNKLFGHEDVSGIEILYVRISRQRVAKRCVSRCSDGGEYKCCCHLLNVPALM